MNELVLPSDAVHAIDPAAKPGTSLFALGLWIRLGFAGLCALMVSAIALFDGATHFDGAPLLAVAGGLLTLVSWQQLRKAMRQEQFHAPEARNVSLNG